MRTSLLPTIRKIAKDDRSKQGGKAAIVTPASDADIVQRRILLMEDDASQRRLYARVLHSAGYSVEEAETLQEARDL
jgi:PleD family two-component response regulator